MRARRIISVPNIPAMIGVLLSSPYPILLEGLEHAFQAEPGFRVLALAETGDQVKHAVTQHRPDVLLLDLEIDNDPLAVVRAVRAKDGPTRVILLAPRIDDTTLLEATRLGVKGVALKCMGRPLLMQCVRKVHNGFTWLDRASTSRIIDRLLRHEESVREASTVLSPRELEIVRLVVTGRSNREIASRLAISDGTVKVHLHHVYEKLNIKGRLELALYARDRDLVLHRAEPAARAQS